MHPLLLGLHVSKPVPGHRHEAHGLPVGLRGHSLGVVVLRVVDVLDGLGERRIAQPEVLLQARDVEEEASEGLDFLHIGGLLQRERVVGEDDAADYFRGVGQQDLGDLPHIKDLRPPFALDQRHLRNTAVGYGCGMGRRSMGG